MELQGRKPEVELGTKKTVAEPAGSKDQKEARGKEKPSGAKGM